MLISQVELPRSWWGTRVGLAGPRSRARGDRRKSGSVGASVSDPLAAPRCPVSVTGQLLAFGEPRFDPRCCSLMMGSWW
jgi:hypothetical protein